MSTDRREARSAANDRVSRIDARYGWACGLYLCPHQPKCDYQYATGEQYEATLDSLEHILFGDVQKRSRDELESRAAEAICGNDFNDAVVVRASVIQVLTKARRNGASGMRSANRPTAKGLHFAEFPRGTQRRATSTRGRVHQADREELHDCDCA